jgi:hypothetical protein
MSFVFYATNLLLLVSFAVLVRQTTRAPEGHEDELGFHFGALESDRASRPAQAVGAKKSAEYPKVTVRHLAA